MSFALQTARLSLRLRDAEFAACNLELKNEGAREAMLMLVDEQQRLDAQRAQALADGFGLLAIRRRREGDLIGYCGLVIGRASVDEPELAYELLPRARGCGYASEAARAVVDAAFATGRRCLWATARPWNAPSLAVLARIGFKPDHSVLDDRGELSYLIQRA